MLINYTQNLLFVLGLTKWNGKQLLNVNLKININKKILNGLKALQSSLKKNEVVSKFGLSDEESLIIIDKMLEDYEYTTVLKYAEIGVKKDQVIFDYMTGSHEELFIRNYFKLALKFEGKPLKSTSICDGGIAKYTTLIQKKVVSKLK